MAKVARAGGFLKKLVGDLVRPVKKWGGDAGRKINNAIPGGKSLRNADGVKVRDWRGRTIKTDDLRHPNANLLDRKALKRAKNRTKADREADAFRPGAPRTDPKVQDLTKNYDPNRTGGTPGWPDGQAHPEGFSSPEGRHPAVLRGGDEIDRFGHGFGRFTSPTGEAYEMRALPDSNLDAGYHQYRVKDGMELPVWQGEAAPAQHQLGGGTQHYLPAPITDLVDAGYLERIYP